MSDCNEILLLDIGNSRIHWRFGQLEGSHALSDHSAVQWPFAANAVTNVCYSAVADADRWQDIAGLFPKAAWYQCEFPEQTILATQYAPTQLGIDRWLALVGAQCVHKIASPCLVVDAGTALTLDLLVNQQHLGGWICPGLETWVKSITDHTDIEIDLKRQPNATVGLNTMDAISNGWLVAARSMITQTLQEKGLTELVMTGGNASILRRYFQDAQYVDNLVLDGLAHWAKVCIKTDQIS